MSSEGDQTIGEIQRRVARLEQRMNERDQERDRFRDNWSDRDIDDLRKMLSGWMASAAIKAFWGSLTGRLVIAGAVAIQLVSFAIALINFFETHHP
jgi:hypothetical protein